MTTPSLCSSSFPCHWWRPNWPPLASRLLLVVAGIFFVVLAAACDTEPPSAPRTPAVVAVSSTSVSLDLGHNGDNVAVTGYKVYRSTTNDFDTAVELGIPAGTETLTRYVDTELTPSSAYYYWAKATDSVNNLSWRSGEVEATTTAAVIDTQRPKPPRRPVVVSATATSVTLELSDDGDNVGVTGFKVFRNTMNDFDNATELPTEVATTAGEAISYTDAGLPASMTYYYWAKAYDAAGNLSWRSGHAFVSTNSTTSDDCDSTAGTGDWRTAQVCGVWQIIGPSGEVVHWNAVNVRGHSFSDNQLDTADVAALKSRFDHVRLNLVWRQMHHDRASLDGEQVQLVRDFLDLAQAHDVAVVLDPVHLSGDFFGIPDWAYSDAGHANNRNHAHSYLAWAGNDHKAVRVQDYLSKLESAGLLTHPAVVAVEVVNEPHPRVPGTATTLAAQQELMTAYKHLIAKVRRFDPQMMMVVGTYHGGFRHGGEITNGQFAHNTAKSVLTEEGIANVVLTAHNYFTGVGDNDGRPDGQRPNGARGAGDWGEGWASAGCYAATDATNVLACGGMPDRAEAAIGHATNAEWQWRYAQEASMPFFMGEWGLPRQRYQSGVHRGWVNAQEMNCDKIAAYSDVDGRGHAISWAVWSFDASVDGFGLYNAHDSIAGDSEKSYLEPNAWVDSGQFPDANQGAWAGQDWEYAAAFGGTC